MVSIYKTHEQKILLAHWHSTKPPRAPVEQAHQIPIHPGITPGLLNSYACCGTTHTCLTYFLPRQLWAWRTIWPSLARSNKMDFCYINRVSSLICSGSERVSNLQQVRIAHLGIDAGGLHITSPLKCDISANVPSVSEVRRSGILAKALAGARYALLGQVSHSLVISFDSLSIYSQHPLRY